MTSLNASHAAPASALSLVWQFCTNAGEVARSATSFIEKKKNAGDEIASDKRALQLLMDAFQEISGRIQGDVWELPIPLTLQQLKSSLALEPAESNAALRRDALFADLLDTIGHTGQNAAKELRQSALKRWTEFQQKRHDIDFSLMGRLADFEYGSGSGPDDGPHDCDDPVVAEEFWDELLSVILDPKEHKWKSIRWRKTRIAILSSSFGINPRLSDNQLSNQINCNLWSIWLTPDSLIEEEDFWPGGTPPWVSALFEVLWFERVRRQIEEERSKPVCLTKAVAIDVLDLYSQQCRPETRNGQQTLLFPGDRGWVIVPSILDETLGEILTRGVDLLSSELGIDILEWEVNEAHKQWTSNPNGDFRHISVEGGWNALAHERLELTKKDAPQMARAIVLAQAHLRFESYGIRGNLLSYAEPRREAPGRRSLVTLTLGDMLLYGFAHALREMHGATSLTSREGRRLVPLLGKAPLTGRKNDYAAQRRMVWRFAIALRDRAVELARSNCVALSIDDWISIASEANAPRSGNFLLRVIDAWTSGDSKVPPLIARAGKDLYTLHSSRKDALDFIITGGEETLRSHDAGKLSAQSRQRVRIKRKSS